MRNETTLLRVRDAALRLSVSEVALRAWISQGLVEVVRLGRAVRFRPETIERLSREGLPAELTGARARAAKAAAAKATS